MQDYGILGKVTNIVTDNGSNFVKAFRVYKEPEEEDASLSEEDDRELSDGEDFDYSSASDVSDTTEEVFCSTFELLSETRQPIICNKEQTNVEQSEEESEQESSDNENDAEETRIVLPNHIRCASHTLSLLASSDFEKSIQAKSVYKLAYKRVLSKLKSLWNKNSKSVIASDATFEILGRYLPRPVETRWNSLFDSVRTLASQNPDKINELLVKLKIPTVSNSENAFLTEFLTIMAPIAISLDTLQGEKNCFLGCVLPLLVKLKEKLVALNLSNSGTAIRCALLAKIESRFGHLFKQDDHVLAAVAHPKFKLNWISDPDEKRVVTRKLEAEIGQSIPSISPMSEDDFLSFDRAVNHECELQRYLNDKCKELSMLDKYPTIKSLFIKYNTAIPSSAPVERLFSVASLVLTARRSRLSDTLLEHLILLKMYRNL